MSAVVWARSLADGRPTVHDLVGAHEREPTTEERVGAMSERLDDGVGATARTVVLAARCGVAVSTWCVETVPGGRFPAYDRIHRSHQHGVRVLARFARLIDARWCAHCWPNGPASAAQA